MGCTRPIVGWLSLEKTTRGKRSVVFDIKRGDVNRPVEVPCGRCIGCRLEYARQWAMRCMHEAVMHDESSYVTLTYNEENLPEGGTLCKRDLQLFIKRVRYHYGDRRIRFFGSGEYGDGGRPHYHVLLFGVGFSDKKPWVKRNGYQIWRSAKLEKIWDKGFSEIGSVDFDSAAYVARYVIKKFRGKPEAVAEYYGDFEPEFGLMSRRPGIGKLWYDVYGSGVREHDTVIVNGREVRPPRFYDVLYEAVDCGGLAKAKARRNAARKVFVEKDGRGDSRLLCEEMLLRGKLSMKGG